MGLLSKSAQQSTAFAFGAVLVGLLLGIAFLCPSPTPFQYTVFRIVLALAAAGAAAMIPGFISVEVGAAVRAGGAIAVFVVVYFFSPAALPSLAKNESLADEYKRHIDQVHTENRGVIAAAKKKAEASGLAAGRLMNELEELDSLKAALEETVIAGEQMAAAANRNLYNDKIQAIKEVEPANGGGGGGNFGLGGLRKVMEKIK